MQHDQTDNILEFQRPPEEPKQLDIFMHYLPSADPNTIVPPEPANDN